MTEELIGAVPLILPDGSTFEADLFRVTQPGRTTESHDDDCPASDDGPGGECICEPFPVSWCPACGEPIDYCQGHGPIGDPDGARILWQHDGDDHSDCHPYGCDEAAAAEAERQEERRYEHGAG